MESLEPRVLLSADGLLAVAVPQGATSSSAVAGFQVVVEDYQGVHESELARDLVYDPADVVNRLFDGIQGDVLASATPADQTPAPGQQEEEKPVEPDQGLMNPGGQVSVQLEPFQTLDLSPGQPASGGAVNSGEEGAQPWAEQLLETLKSPNGPPDGQGSVDSGLVSVDGGLSTASVLSATSNSSAFSSGLHALSVSSPSFSPQRPLIFVPGFGGSFAADSAVGEWLTTRGLSPDKLQLDPLANTYGDLVRTLETAGYVLDQTLFVANWDWRLAVAPSDGIADGNISGLSASTLTDNEFTYGVDYLSNAMKQAVDRWKDQHGGTAPDSVDIVSHSTGGLIARAYIESGAYPLSTDLNPVLP
ncbi:MAG: LEPR-XLL domain-containing protein, partial [Verrucomicrobiota bacterium]